jgi:hypothetical protein
MPGLPLSTALSQLLIAFTIEYDNEFDHRLTEADVGRRLPISMVMWSNFMRFVGDGITVGELPAAAGIPKSRTLSTLGGMERWRYVFVSAKSTGPPPKSKRDGWGSGRALRREWFVRPTPAGRTTQEIAPPLFGEMERRWEKRFGAAAIDELRQALDAVIDGLGVELPEPTIAGVSPEATSMALRSLAKTGYVVDEAKLARLTPKGLEAQAAAPGLHADLERARRRQRLRKAVAAVLDQSAGLSEGLRPYPDGWRARKQYVEQTNAVIADPTGRLPHYPMVLHRGGWPDGS